MNIRMILCWAVLQIPITGYCSEWIYVTRDTMGDEFFVDRASFEQDEYKIFFRGLRFWLGGVWGLTLSNLGFDRKID